MSGLPSWAQEKREQLFLAACRESRFDDMKKMLTAGDPNFVDLNNLNESGLNLFAQAILDKNVSAAVLEFLLANGANPNPERNLTSGRGAPMTIAFFHNIEALKVLLKHNEVNHGRIYDDDTLKLFYRFTYPSDEKLAHRAILLDHAKKLGKSALMPALNTDYLNDIRRNEVDPTRYLPRAKLKQKLIDEVTIQLMSTREGGPDYSTLSTAELLRQPVSLKHVKFTRLERLLLGKKADQPWTLAAALNVHRHLLHRNLTQSYKHWMHESMHDAKTTLKDKVILFLQMTVDRMKSEPFHRQSGKEFALTTLLEDLKADKSHMTLRDLCEFRGTGPDPLLRVLLTHRTGRDEALNSGMEFDAEAFRQLDQPKSYQEFAKEFDLESQLGEQKICDILNAGEKPALNHK